MRPVRGPGIYSRGARPRKAKTVALLSGAVPAIERPFAMNSSHAGIWVAFNMLCFDWPGRTNHALHCPKWVRDDGLTIALDRIPEVTLAQFAKDCGFRVGTHHQWHREDRFETGQTPDVTRSKNAKRPEHRKRTRLLEPEAEVLRGESA